MKSDVSSPFCYEIFFKKNCKSCKQFLSKLFYRFLLISGYSSKDFVHHCYMPFLTGLLFSYNKTVIFVVESTSNNVCSNKRG